MTAAEAARILECSPRYVRLLCERGALPAWKIGRSGWRISEQSVEAFRERLTNHMRTAPAMTPTIERTDVQPVVGIAGLPDGFEPTFPDIWS